MGKTVIANYSLPEVEYRYASEEAYRDKPVLYGLEKLTAAWFQPLKLTGNYRMEIQFTRDDVIRLFKCLFGNQLHTSLVEEYGLTFSPELIESLVTALKMTALPSSPP